MNEIRYLCGVNILITNNYLEKNNNTNFKNFIIYKENQIFYSSNPNVDSFRLITIILIY